MLIKTNAVAYSAESFHSNKTNKDYHRVGLIIEGQATPFFVNDNEWNNIVKQPFFNAVCASHKPTEVEAEFELKFTEKGPQTYLQGLREIKAKAN